MPLNEHAARNVTIDTCHALQFHLEPRPSEVSRSVIIWRGSRADFRLVGRSRLRDVRAVCRSCNRGEAGAAVLGQMHLERGILTLFDIISQNLFASAF